MCQYYFIEFPYQCIYVLHSARKFAENVLKNVPNMCTTVHKMSSVSDHSCAVITFFFNIKCSKFTATCCNGHSPDTVKICAFGSFSITSPFMMGPIAACSSSTIVSLALYNAHKNMWIAIMV